IPVRLSQAPCHGAGREIGAAAERQRLPDGEAALRSLAATCRRLARPSDGRRYHRLFSDFDGPVDEASVSVPLAHKRAVLWRAAFEMRRPDQRWIGSPALRSAP